MTPDAFERAVDELYGLPLDAFVPRRDELARELREAGAGEDAALVRRLSKPSVSAWAVNRLARERAGEIRELVAAGDELRRVQEWLLRREAEPADLRAAVEAERAAVAGLVHHAADLLTAAGRPARGDVLERIGETLHAAAADEGVRAEVERGRVVHDRAAVGIGSFGGGGGGAAAPGRVTRRRGSRGRKQPAGEPARRPERGEAETHAGAEADAERRRAVEAAREAIRAAEAEAQAADRMRAAAERAVERASRALAGAEASWERARDDLHSARDELAAARKAADAAREAAAAAQAEAEERRRAAGDED